MRDAVRGTLLTFQSRVPMVVLRCFRFSGKLSFSCGYTFRGSASCSVVSRKQGLKSASWQAR